MTEVDPALQYWGWFFLAFYIAAMLFFGYMGMRRVKNSDDFATARDSYGPIFLAFALTATAASGGTFLGIPALGYKFGLPAMWYAVMYLSLIHISEPTRLESKSRLAAWA